MNEQFALMYDDTNRVVFVQKFDEAGYKKLIQKERRPEKPYPVTAFASYKAAAKEAKRISKRSTYTYDSGRDFI